MSLAFDPPVKHHSPGDTTRAVTTEEAFEALSNQRRRYVVHWLLETEARTEIRELSRQVAAWENNKPADRVTAQERRRVYNALQQFHLPKLDDIGVIRYDSDRGVVEPTEELELLRAYLDASRRHGGWRSRPLPVGGGLVGLIAIALVTWSFGALSGAILAVLAGVAVLGALVVHRFVGRHGTKPRPFETES